VQTCVSSLYVCMYVCMYVCIYVCMYVCMYACYMYAVMLDYDVEACVSIHTHTYTSYIHTHIYTSANTYTYTHICIYMYIHTHHTYIHLYKYKYDTHTHIHTHATHETIKIYLRILHLDQRLNFFHFVVVVVRCERHVKTHTHTYAHTCNTRNNQNVLTKFCAMIKVSISLILSLSSCAVRGTPSSNFIISISPRWHAKCRHVFSDTFCVCMYICMYVCMYVCYGIISISPCWHS
jgi:hypothetical protein